MSPDRVMTEWPFLPVHARRVRVSGVCLCVRVGAHLLFHSSDEAAHGFSCDRWRGELENETAGSTRDGWTPLSGPWGGGGGGGGGGGRWTSDHHHRHPAS